MGYQRRGASFTFMGFVPIGKSYDVVPDREEHPALRRSPTGRGKGQSGTVGMEMREFAHGLRASPPVCRIHWAD